MDWEALRSGSSTHRNPHQLFVCHFQSGATVQIPLLDADAGQDAKLADDPTAQRLVALSDLICSFSGSRFSSARTRREHCAGMEDTNPSRALLTLAKRGFVVRNAVQGGSAGLIEAGRDEMRKILTRRQLVSS